MESTGTKAKAMDYGLIWEERRSLVLVLERIQKHSGYIYYVRVVLTPGGWRR